MGPSNHVLDEGLDPSRERGNLGIRKGSSIVKYREHEQVAAERQLAHSRWHLERELAGTEGTMC